MKNKDRVLVVAVHPDDETLGAGGTLLKHKAQGDQVYWLIVTKAHPKDGFSAKAIAEKEKTIKSVASRFGFDGVVRMNIPSTHVDETPMGELVTKVSQILNQVRPGVVYLPFRGDVHSDHRKFFEAIYSCTKTFRYPFIKKLLMMETISETELAPPLAEFAFMPNYFVDISPYLTQKLNIMKLYKSEMAEHPFPRSSENIQALATFRGAMAGCRYAESFMLLKEIA